MFDATISFANSNRKNDIASEKGKKNSTQIVRRMRLQPIFFTLPLQIDGKEEEVAPLAKKNVQ